MGAHANLYLLLDTESYQHVQEIVRDYHKGFPLSPEVPTTDSLISRLKPLGLGLIMVQG